MVIVEACSSKHRPGMRAPPRGGDASRMPKRVAVSGNQGFQALPERGGCWLASGFERQHRVVVNARFVDVRQL
ncbi:hypothetical protein BPC006_I0295 [Burkholderia pseudomallei BPC006]|nr:hypothetical protein BPC006_I0295 [Burkholderia pseudomallei BPC006]